jgi:hypothetical protein
MIRRPQSLLQDEYPIVVSGTLAKLLGLHEAILLQQVNFWINLPKNDKVHNGRLWVYDSARTWREKLPFLSEKQIYVAFNNLERAGLIIMACFNKAGYDRTRWYTIDYEVYDLMRQDEAERDARIAILPVGQMDLPCGENGFALQGGPIPTESLSITTDSETAVSVPSLVVPPRYVPTVPFTDNAAVKRAAKAAQRIENKAKKRGAAEIIAGWPEDQRKKVRNYLWAYLRGVAPLDKVPVEPDAEMMIGEFERVLTIDETRFDPDDFLAATRHYYQSWKGLVSVRKIREKLGEWDARGRPK